MSPKIDNHAAGICVDGAEQCANRIVESDQENARAERLQIFRDETHPQFFPRADDKNREQENNKIAFQSEKTGDSRKPEILRLAWRIILRRWRIGVRFHLGLVQLLSSKPARIVDLVYPRFVR